MRFTILGVLLLACVTAFPQESQLAADFRHEHQDLAGSCGKGLSGFMGCAQTLFTDHPLHIAVGSIAPQNGFGAGLAFVTHYTPNEKWRLSWDFDAIGSSNASWRAGGYMKIIHTPPRVITPIAVTTTPGSKPPKSNLAVRPYTVFNIYAQGIGLNKLFYFGEGPNTLPAGQSVFSEQQAIIGGNGIVPVYQPLALSLFGEINGRFVTIGSPQNQGAPSIGTLYDNATAPGLATQPGFAQFGEGIRMNPNFFHDHLQLKYQFTFQQFVAPSNSTYSFRRWTGDFEHIFPLYGKTPPGPRAFNGPDQCSTDPGKSCPPISYSINRQGAIGVRVLLTESIADAGSVVPFYFQPTLGGSDINGNSFLPSFNDYRFRAPNLLLIRESIEHSIWGPFGFNFVADQGKVAMTRSDVNFSNLTYSFAGGFTIRAGGMPMVYFLFAWGAGSSGHNIVTVDTSLLGGSARPSLF
jgi:hypothetical protein